MTVEELRQLLSDLPDHREVILAKDSEGNEFSPLSLITESIYDPHSTWSGEVTETEDDTRTSNAVVLYPAN